MPVIIVNWNRELRKAAQGKKTKVPMGIVLHYALRGYPEIQNLVDRAFGVKEIY